MMKKFKFLALIFAAVFAVTTFASCSSEEENESTGESKSVSIDDIVGSYFVQKINGIESANGLVYDYWYFKTDKEIIHSWAPSQYGYESGVFTEWTTESYQYEIDDGMVYLGENTPKSSYTDYTFDDGVYDDYGKLDVNKITAFVYNYSTRYVYYGKTLDDSMKSKYGY